MVQLARGAPQAQDKKDAHMTLPKLTTIRVLLSLLLAGAAAAASAQERPQHQPTPHAEQQRSEQHQGAQRASVLRLLPGDSVTEHTIDLPGGKLAYTATAGRRYRKDKADAQTQALSSTASVG